MIRMIFDRSEAVDVPVMMVAEVTGPGHVRQKLSSCSLPRRIWCVRNQ